MAVVMPMAVGALERREDVALAVIRLAARLVSSSKVSPSSLAGGGGGGGRVREKGRVKGRGEERRRGRGRGRGGGGGGGGRERGRGEKQLYIIMMKRIVVYTLCSIVTIRLL